MARSVYEHDHSPDQPDEQEESPIPSSEDTLLIRSVHSRASSTAAPLPRRRWSGDTVHRELAGSPDTSSPFANLPHAPTPSSSTASFNFSSAAKSLFGGKRKVSKQHGHGRSASSASMMLLDLNDPSSPPRSHPPTHHRSRSISAFFDLSIPAAPRTSTRSPHATVSPQHIKSKLHSSPPRKAGGGGGGGGRDKLLSPRKKQHSAKSSMLGRAWDMVGKVSSHRKREKHAQKAKKVSVWEDDQEEGGAAGPITGAAAALDAAVDRVVASISSGRDKKKKKRPRASDESGRTAAMRRSLRGVPATATTATPGQFKRRPRPSSGSVRRIAYRAPHNTPLYAVSSTRKRAKLPSSGSARKLINRPRPIPRSETMKLLRASQRMEEGSSVGYSRRSVSVTSRRSGEWPLVDEFGNRKLFPQLNDEQEYDTSPPPPSNFGAFSSPTPALFARASAPSPASIHSQHVEFGHAQPTHQTSTPSGKLAAFDLHTTLQAVSSSPAPVFSTPSPHPPTPINPLSGLRGETYGTSDPTFAYSPAVDSPSTSASRFQFVTPRVRTTKTRRSVTLPRLSSLYELPSHLHPAPAVGSSELEELALGGSTPQPSSETTPKTDGGSRMLYSKPRRPSMRPREPTNDELEKEICELLESSEASITMGGGAGAEAVPSPFKDAPDDETDWETDASSSLSYSRPSSSLDHDHDAGTESEDDGEVVVTSARRLSIERVPCGLAKKTSLSSLRSSSASGSGSGRGAGSYISALSPMSPLFSPSSITSFPPGSPIGRSTSYAPAPLPASSSSSFSRLEHPPRSFSHSYVPPSSSLVTATVIDRVGAPHPSQSLPRPLPGGALRRNHSGRAYTPLPPLPGPVPSDSPLRVPEEEERRERLLREVVGVGGGGGFSRRGGGGVRGPRPVSTASFGTSASMTGTFGAPHHRFSNSVSLFSNSHSGSSSPSPHDSSSPLLPHSRSISSSHIPATTNTSHTSFSSHRHFSPLSPAFPLPQTGSEKQLLGEVAREVFGRPSSSSVALALGGTEEGEGGGEGGRRSPLGWTMRGGQGAARGATGEKGVRRMEEGEGTADSEMRGWRAGGKENEGV